MKKTFFDHSSSRFYSGIPAEACEEIKRSEEGEATSGEYWLYSIITGKTVLVSCDIEREGSKTEVFVVLVVDINITFLIPVM